MKKDFLKLAAAFCLLLVGLAFSGCGESRSRFAGTYRAEVPGMHHVDLELKGDGKGTWTLAGKTVEFKWTVNNGKVWLYLRSGVILIATPSQDAKELTLDLTGQYHLGCPTQACLTFKRSSEGG